MVQLLAAPAFGETGDPRPIVPASEILVKIERGEPVEYDGVIVVGDLDLSGLDLPTKRVERTEEEIKYRRLTEEVKVVKSLIWIQNSEIRGKLNLSNAEFQKAISFWGTNFTQESLFFGSIFTRVAYFEKALFCNYTNFNGAVFNGKDNRNTSANFMGAIFSGGDADFQGVNFSGGSANFARAEFSGGAADFYETEFSGGDAIFWDANFSGGNARFDMAVFSDNAYFSSAFFSYGASFFLAVFKGEADFSWVRFSGDDASFLGANFSGGDAHFHFVKFSGGDARFWRAVFSGGNASFKGNEFSGGEADFSEAVFSGGFADFSKSIFSGGVADFTETEFSGGYADFTETEFNGGKISFSKAKFSSNAYFRDAQFIGGDTSFTGAVFLGRNADFRGAVFKDIANFDFTFVYTHLTLEDAKNIRILRFSNALFWGGSTICLNGTDYQRLYVHWYQIQNALIFNGEVYLNLVKNFRNIEYFEDADGCYYHYRREKQSMRSWYEATKYIDILAWLTCGYGVRPGYTLGWSFGLIFFFGIVFWAGNGIHRIDMLNRNNTKAKVKEEWRFSSVCNMSSSKICNIIRKIFSTSKILIKVINSLLKIRISTLRHFPVRILNASFVTEISFKDALYFSTMVFVSMPPHDWRPKEGWKYAVMLEDVLGWLLLALFLVTLGNVMIR